MTGYGPLTAVPRAARSIGDQWRALCAPTPAPPPFDPGAVGALPAPVGRWLRHTIPPGTPVTRGVALSMHGTIRLGAWRSFTARQVLAAGRGFVWSASARFGPVPVTGFDRYVDGAGEMRWRLLGAVPVMSSVGPDVTRSAAGRLAIETMLSPPAALGPSVGWLTVDDVGRLTGATMLRWGAPLQEPAGLYPFGVFFTGEREVDGVRMADRIEAGWFAGTDRWADGVFFRATLDGATRL
ncbi:DUF6544 family protein [Cellulomonas sp. KRMCY2]|uniref:DUF6544 family protein n=1 Tax=Cellulomonas sp. KRMCY2 TaxID=1304865 RepID=UPI00045E6476|nr:DUF6544 family protein [Cellulomonas sp. KRMCY2]